MVMSTLVYPQANGQAESNNKIIVNNLKKRLDKKKRRWGEELPFLLWANRTTSKVATSQTPYPLVFGTEAMIPIKVVIPIARYLLQNQEDNSRILAQDLDTTDELSDISKIRVAAHQQRITRAYNKIIRIRRFQVGDLVLRKTFQNTKDPGATKLDPKSEGPYLIDVEAGNKHIG